MPQTTKQSWAGFTNTTRKVIKAYFISAQAAASPFLCPNHRGFSGINQRLELAATPPQAQREAVFAPRWTLKRLVVWIKESHGMDCCRETVRKALKKLGFSGKKWRKRLNKANPKQREVFVDKLQGILSAATQGQEQLVYLDEAHIHLD